MTAVQSLPSPKGKGTSWQLTAKDELLEQAHTSLFCIARLHCSLQQTAPISRGQTESNSLNQLSSRAVSCTAGWALTQVLSEGPGQQRKELTRRWGAAQDLAMGSIYLRLLRPVQRDGFMARVPGVDLAGIHLEDSLGTPRKHQMKGWVSAVLVQDLTPVSTCFLHRALQEAFSSSWLAAAPASSSAAKQFYFCCLQKGREKQEAYKQHSVQRLHNPFPIPSWEQHLGASPI